MDFKKMMLVIFAIAAAIVVPPSFATEFIVGDETGWTINFDYQAWAAGKNFYVGDTLVFKYPVGVHNVHKANLTAFQQCQVPLTAPLATGNDVITLATPGKKWYICGVGKHCQAGNQKLAITVSDASSASPAPAPSASIATTLGSSISCQAWMALGTLATLWMAVAA
ncbi:hypothetical protein QQ045_003593 [Rhodiola kirilowii]